MKLKDFPRELLINGNLWKIKYVKHLPHPNPKKITYAEYYPEERAIRIVKGHPYIEMLDSLIHEVIHACEFEYGFELRHSHVHKLGEVLAKLYIDNF